MAELEKSRADIQEDNSPTIIELQKPTTVETLHNDEALKVLAKYSGDTEWTEQEEKKLKRKIDRKLMFILCLTYGLQYYDKAMLSQAALFGLREDLDLEIGNRYPMSASIFYLGFICGAYPAILMAQRWPIERVASGIVMIWGVCLMCTAACHSYQALYAQRFFLGFLESGVSPMFMLVVGSWYKKGEQALRMGAWYCMTGYVSIFSPLINYGVGHINGGSLSPWQYMYILAGGLTILWSIVIFFMMPPDPIRAKGFNERERYIAVARLRVNNSGVRNTHFKKPQVWELLRDLKFWIVFSMAFLIMIANGPVSTFIPIFIAGFGYSPLQSFLLVMPAGAIIGTVELVAPLCAFKISRARTYIIAICQCGTIMAAFILWLCPRDAKGGLLFGTYFLATFGGSYAVLMGVSIANTAGYTKKSASSTGIFMGYCLGNFVGPLIFKTKDAPTYAPGFIAVIVTSIIAAVLSIVYRFVCIWENKKRDRNGVEAFEHAYEDDLTDKKNPQFRYTI